MMVNVRDPRLSDDSPVETYLGDGVYASFDGTYIWLRAPHEYDNQRVALEPQVYAALVQFVTNKTNKEWRDQVSAYLT